MKVRTTLEEGFGATYIASHACTAHTLKLRSTKLDRDSGDSDDINVKLDLEEHPITSTNIVQRSYPSEHILAMAIYWQLVLFDGVPSMTAVSMILKIVQLILRYATPAFAIYRPETRLSRDGQRPV